MLGLFVNKPDGLNKSGFHIFTEIEPGQVKILERSSKPVRMVMNTSGKRFSGAKAVDSPEHWEIVDVEEDEDSENPTDRVWLPIRWWAALVYEWTGLVFTGVYPFQKVREYELERTVQKRNEEDGQAHNTGSQRTKSNLVLTVKSDMSDHFRTRQFLFPVHVTGAETKDKIPLDVIGVLELEVVNPHKAAYGTDRWDNAIINLVTDTVISTTKQMELDAALTAENVEETQRISNAVKAIEADTEVTGIQINGFRILEINPVLNEAGLDAIQAEAIANQKAKATRIDGKARADALRAINDANQVGGDAAIATMEAEAFVRAAEAAGKNGTVFITPGSRRSEADPIQAAILAELQKINRKE